MYKSPPAEAARQPVLATLLPVMTAVLAGFSIIGVALPVLPLYVNNDLGFGPFMIGLVAGAQFAAALVSRIWAGSFPTGAVPNVACSQALSLLLRRASCICFRSLSRDCRRCPSQSCLPVVQSSAEPKALSSRAASHGGSDLSTDSMPER